MALLDRVMRPVAPIHRKRLVAAALSAVSALVFASSPVTAERLPLTQFTSAQGLASDQVVCALEDSRGFLWFGTSSGISRFDGHGFRSFGADRGLEIPYVSSLAEHEDGSLFVGAHGVVYRFDPAAGGSFRKIPSVPPMADMGVLLHRDRRGTMWAAANGLYRLEDDAGQPIFRHAVGSPPEVEVGVFAIAEDLDGNLWLGSRGLFGLSAEGRRLRASIPPEFEWVFSLAVDSEGRVWAAAAEGLCLLDPREPAPAAADAECRALPPGGVFNTKRLKLIARSGGGVWAAHFYGLYEIDSAGQLLRTIGKAQGMPAGGNFPLLLDSAGSLWVAAWYEGIVRIGLGGFTSFGAAEGLEETRIASILRTRSGELVVVGVGHILQRFGEGRFTSVRPNLPAAITYEGWGWQQVQLQHRDGDWWIPTGEGIVRFGPVGRLEELARARPKAIYTEKDGLPNREIFRLFEDSRGDIWVSTLYHPPPFGPGGSRPTLSRWECATGAFHQYGAAQGVREDAAPTAFIELPDGTLWIGFSKSVEVYRRRGGAFQRLDGPRRALGQAFVTAMTLFRDGKGRIWIATRGAGACRVDDPGARDPVCVPITTREGLSSDQVNGVAEDDLGRIYIGTSRGVDVLEGDRVIRHLDRPDGLPHQYVNVMHEDADGAIWFGTLNGLARLRPGTDLPAPAPPRVLIDGLRVAGVPRVLSALGEKIIEDLVLAPDERRLQIDFIGLSHERGERLRFQHRLAGAEAWSDPTPETTLLLPNLTPGRYRFEVRAIDAAGRTSAEPAVVSFRVLAPVWRRPWFLALAAGVVLAAAFAAYRARVAHLLALEHQRMQIAMDLHDELGSGLGSIGVLADLAADDGLEAPRRGELLDQVATTASELGASMGDIVWSLRAGSGTIESLARHLSERGRRLFPEGGAVLQTRFPASWPKVGLSLATRHNLAMIGLEALHNAARHSGATVVTLDLMPEEGRWRLSVSDNGRGLKAEAPVPDGVGLGLTSMRRRAQEIGAELQVESRVDEGTTVTVVFDPAVGGKGRIR